MQAQEQLGTCCLYTVIEWAREQLPEWLAASATAARESLQESPAKIEPSQPSEAKTQEDEVCHTAGRRYAHLACSPYMQPRLLACNFT